MEYAATKRQLDGKRDGGRPAGRRGSWPAGRPASRPAGRPAADGRFPDRDSREAASWGSLPDMIVIKPDRGPDPEGPCAENCCGPA